MRERLPLGLVVRMVLRGAKGFRVVPRVLFSRGSLERRGRSKLQSMGGGSMGGVLRRGSIPWEGGSWVGEILAGV